MMTKTDMILFAGRSTQTLAAGIARHLRRKLGDCEARTFSDGEIWVKYKENIRGRDVFIIQSTNPPADNLMELLIMVDAAKRSSAYRVTAVIPYFGYARQDRKDQPRVAISAKLIADLLSAAGADRVITMDLHAPQIQGFFDIPVDHLYSSAVFINFFKAMKIKNLAVATPDVGGIKMAAAYAKRLHADLVVMDKRRPKPNVAAIMNIIGEPGGKNILLVDDLIDTGGTMMQAVQKLYEHGAKSVMAACTHPVFSGEAAQRMKESGIERMFVTDTLPLPESIKRLGVVRIRSVATLFAEAIKRTNRHESISSLFDVVKD
jgi:ribose-phosphate pyrophosphokinase